MKHAFALKILSSGVHENKLLQIIALTFGENRSGKLKNNNFVFTSFIFSEIPKSKVQLAVNLESSKYIFKDL